MAFFCLGPAAPVAKSIGILFVSPTNALVSSGSIGGPFSPSSQVYAVTNIGSTSLNWSATKAQNWVTLSATNGTLASHASINVTVSINPNANALTIGNYSDSVSFTNLTNANGTTNRAVSLTVNAGVLAVTPPAGLAASGFIGGPFSQSSQMYTLTNSGNVMLSWAASKGQSWLSLSATSGTLPSGASTSVTASINSNANALAVGTYSDSIVFTNLTYPAGTTSRNVSLTINGTGRAVLAGGAYHSLALASNGSVSSWGNDGWGELGNSTTINSSVPVQVNTVNRTIAVSAGVSGAHSTALRSDGTVWTWGENDDGELGNGTSDGNPHPSPSQVGGLSGVVGIAAGSWHNLALKSDGSVWAWGWNVSGQIGDGTTTERHTPVPVSGLTGVITVAAGGWHSVVVRSDGSVWDWGGNNYGQLGNGTANIYWTPMPVQANGMTSAVAVAAGWSHTLALRADGSAWAWGRNDYGQLGDGTTTNNMSPVQVGGLGNAIVIAGGGLHSLAIKSDGTVWAWGSNGYGQLGNGTTNDSAVPVRVSGLTNAVAIACGLYHSVASTSDGTVWAWGWNDYGQLGNGTTAGSSVPVQVSGLNVGRGQLLASPISVDFGRVLTGRTAQASFTVTNSGGAALSGIASVPAPFAIVTSLPFTVPAFGTTIVIVTFTPITVGNFNANVVFSAGNGTASTNQLSGVGVPPPLLTVTPQSSDFGAVATGATAQTSFTLTNSTDVPLSGSASVPAPFTIVSGSPFTLAGSSATNVIVGFTPLTVSSFTNNVIFSSNGGISTNQVSGVGILPPPPAAPSSLSASAVSSNQNALAWLDNSNNELGFLIERAPDNSGVPGAWAQIAGVTPNITAYNDTGLAPFSVFWYRIRAYNNGGNSPYSNQANAGHTVNHTPVAVNDTVNFWLGGPPVSFNVLTNDFDADGDVLNMVSYTQPQRGSLSSAGNGVFSFQPAASFTNGQDTFSYTVEDGFGGSNTASVLLRPQARHLDGGDWPTFGNGPGHTGYYPGVIGTNLFVASWTNSFPLTINPVAVGAGAVYVTLPTFSSYDQNPFYLAALDAITGQQRWRFDFANNSAWGMNPPTYADGKIYTQRTSGGYDSQLWCISTNGTPVWSAPWVAQFGTYYAPCVSGDGVWIGGGGFSGMYGFSTNGTQRFFFDPHLHIEYTQWTPTYYQGTLYSWLVGTFRAHDPIYGTELWSINIGGGYTISAIEDGRAFVMQPNLYAIDLTTHAIIWTQQVNFAGSPATHNGIVYGIVGNEVRAYRASDGTPSGTYKATNDTTLGYQPIVTDDSLLVAGSANTYIFDLLTHQLRQTIPYGGTLALANGRLYVANNNLLKTYLLDAADIDSNHDGLPDTWQMQNFGCITCPDAAPGSDPDGDGFSNLQEYLAGVNPMSSTSYFHIVSIQPSGIDMLVTWMMGGGKTNALQAMTGSYNTNNYADIFVVTNTLGTTTNFLDTGGATNKPARYYRVRLVP